MGKHYFTDEQVQELSMNPYVKKVTNKSITYAESFKELFIERYKEFPLPTMIFRECGFDPKVLGERRITMFSERTRKQAQRIEGFQDLRKDNSGRPKTKGLTDAEIIEQLKYKNEVLQQENDFLKRIRLINNKAISKQNKQRKKNTK